MLNKNLNILGLIFLLFVSCKNEKLGIYEERTLKYAQNFELEYNKDYKKIIVFYPWQGARNKKIEYILTKNPKNLSEENAIIKVPVDRVICLSSTYIGYLEYLGVENTVVGVSGKDYIYNPLLRNKIANGQIKDVGYEQNLDIETIIKLKPDVIFAYDINGSLSSKYEYLEKLGIKIIIVSEYLESNPLGRAEWIKFFASFFDKEDKADSLFEIVEKNYLWIKDKEKNYMPQILVNIPYNGIWYVPGGKSFMAKLISDAGGKYIFSDDTSRETVITTMEKILQKKDSIDILLNPGIYQKKTEIINKIPQLSYLKCFKTGKIFNNNKRTNKLGGNDFYESGSFRMDLILKDLYKIFKGQTDSLFYYQKLEN